MRNRVFAAAVLALLAPTAVFAASAATTDARNSVAAITTVAGTTALHAYAADRDDPRCGRGNSWGCRRDRDDRYDDRRDRDRYNNDRFDRDRYERHRYERARWERERYARERYARQRYERARQLERYRYRDRRYSRYDRQPVACIRAGGRVIGSAVLTICIP
ncbi:MAG: hypothetical protein H7099_07420 [Gemmatimonadaceae bacterium]|nr:hypothetical protein [Gemmatimonadaceae bacterium]